MHAQLNYIYFIIFLTFRRDVYTHTHNPRPFVCGSPLQILFVELNFSLNQHNRGRTTTFEKSFAGLASVMASFDFASEVVTEGHLDKLLWLWLIGSALFHQNVWSCDVHSVIKLYIRITLPETNIAPGNAWLQILPFGMAYFSRSILVLGSV